MARLEQWAPGLDGAWDLAAAHHFHARAGFGASRETLERSVEAGFEATLEARLAAREPHPQLDRAIRPLLAGGSEAQLAGWWMSLILADHAPLVERVALMWHDHFATSNAKVGDVRLMHAQNVLFRTRGLGSFRELLHAIARDPAMLVWLDGNENKQGQPNENFAREVMELFALGIGNYTEEDVQEAARAFTGWGTRGRRFVERAADHDDGAKTIFGRRSNLDGNAALEAILDHPACARHVARRLLEEFVGTGVSESDVDAVAADLVSNDWEIAATLRTLFRSKLFHDPAARRSRISGPVETIARAVLATGARVAPSAAAQAASRMGQSLFAPPSVKGWDGGRSWIDAGSWIERHNLLARLAGAHANEQDGVRVDLQDAFGSPSDRAELARAAIESLLPGHEDPGYRAVLERSSRAASSDDEALRDVATLILTSPEFHLC